MPTIEDLCKRVGNIDTSPLFKSVLDTFSQIMEFDIEAEQVL
jgi:hypothetical protein